jgi:NAD(P)-dependent dehydrogenase (short-subunit alcohol dehydrogenase family)
MSKVWFITGTSKGLGRALVEEILASQDHKVVATARNAEALQDLAKSYPDRLLVLSLDVQDIPSIQRAAQEAIRHFSKIDILVNNAGYGLVGALEECSPEELQSVFATNVFGLIETTRALLPHFRKQKSGHILNISSIVGLVATPGLGAYNATKFAVEGISESLALELAHFGIKVSIIEPGPFRTDFTGSSLKHAKAHPDYAASQATAFRDFLSKAHNKQAGDPVRAAKCMIALTQMADPPLRLLLGNDAVDRTYATMHKQMQEFKAHEALARSADYPDTQQIPYPLKPV